MISTKVILFPGGITRDEFFKIYGENAEVIKRLAGLSELTLHWLGETKIY